MKRIAVIGVGQLGSRHLQGIKKSKNELEIWAVDSNRASLDMAKDRFGQILSINNKLVHYVESLDVLPESLEIVIIATSSKPRAGIITQLLASHHIENLILEKFLFNRLGDYDLIGNLLHEKQVSTYVNTPRRLYVGYERIKKYLRPNVPISLLYQGSNWGLCCNSIHFIDLSQYLTGSGNFIIDTSGLLPHILSSKRSGYIELEGTIVVKSDRGDVLKLICEESVPPFMELRQESNCITIDEMSNTYLMDGQQYDLGLKYQSDLTGSVIDELLLKGFCGLPTYESSSMLHKLFLSEILSFVNKVQKTNEDNCPIT